MKMPRNQPDGHVLWQRRNRRPEPQKVSPELNERNSLASRQQRVNMVFPTSDEGHSGHGKRQDHFMSALRASRIRSPLGFSGEARPGEVHRTRMQHVTLVNKDESKHRQQQNLSCIQ
mmetsp:Transcript_635/g.1648  ORF Transcript_635/g.1648 Transcript_635/m.1648 type:complete len:117 (-) Transcript_635:66-416(-)